MESERKWGVDRVRGGGGVRVGSEEGAGGGGG